MVKSTTVVCEHGITAAALSAWHDHDLDETEEREIGEHISTCSACRLYVEDIDAVIAALRAQPVPVLSESLSAGIAERRSQHPVWSPLSLPRQRPILSGIGAVAAVILILAGFAALFNRTAGNGVSTPPPPSLRNDGSLAVIESNLSFGSVTVNGYMDVGGPPFFFNLGSEGATVTYLAPPFKPETCEVSWGAGGASGPSLNVRGAACNYADFVNGVGGRVNGQALDTSVGLVFQFGLNDLPSSFQASALDVVRNGVTPVSLSETVPSGQYYATGRNGQGMILSRRATTSLKAKISLVLPSAQDLSSAFSQCPTLVCAQNGPIVPVSQPSTLHGKLWQVVGSLALNWQFRLPDGQLVGSEDEGETQTGFVLTLALNSQEQWHLAQPYHEQQFSPWAFCSVAEDDARSAFQYHHVDLNSYNLSQLDQGGPAGCELEAVSNDGTVMGTLVWRFGVLLAADANTHSNYPWLPLAPAAEVAAVSDS